MKRSKQSLSGALAALGAVTALSFDAQTAVASSHREAPLIAEDPAADATDLYTFRTPTNAVDIAVVPNSLVMVANYWPLEEPGGGPNWPRFSDQVLYEIKVDNDGDAVEDITYQFRFKTQYVNPGSFLLAAGKVTTANSQNLQVRQSYSVTRVDKGGGSTVLLTDQLTPPVYAGDFTMGNEAAYQAMADSTVYALGGDATTNGRVFAGQRDDPFFVDLGAVFDLVRIRCNQVNDANTAAGCAGGGAAKVKGVDFVGGYNVHSIVLQVPIEKLTTDGTAAPTGKNAIIGAWTTASRQRVTIFRAPSLGAFAGGTPVRDDHGQWVQVSRLGLPLINEVIVPIPFKDYYNTTPPSNDAALFTSDLGKPLLTNPELAQAMKALYNIQVPAAGRTDILEVTQFHVAASDGGAPIGPFKGKTYSLAPADILRVDLSLPAPVDQVTNPLGAGGVVLAGAADANIGFPNGRRLHDDIVDILELVVGGVFRGTQGIVGVLTDGVDANDRAFLTTFPYVPLPWSGSQVGNPKGLTPGNSLLHQARIIQ